MLLADRGYYYSSGEAVVKKKKKKNVTLNKSLLLYNSVFS